MEFSLFVTDNSAVDGDGYVPMQRHPDQSLSALQYTTCASAATNSNGDNAIVVGGIKL